MLIIQGAWFDVYALKQIENQMYAKQLEEDYDEVLCYGIAFFKKRCMVKNNN